MNLKEEILQILGTTKGLPQGDITRMLVQQNNEAAEKILALFKHHKTEADRLLRELADLQNGPPLERHRVEWELTMERIYAYLDA